MKSGRQPIKWCALFRISLYSAVSVYLKNTYTILRWMKSYLLVYVKQVLCKQLSTHFCVKMTTCLKKSSSDYNRYT